MAGGYRARPNADRTDSVRGQGKHMNMLAIRVIAAFVAALFGDLSLGAQVQVRTEAGVVAGAPSAD